MSNNIRTFITHHSKTLSLLVLLQLLGTIAHPVFAETPFKNLSLLGNKFNQVLSDYIVHPDGERVIFRADKDLVNDYEIYVTQVTGGTITKLSKSLINGGEIRSFKLSPDGNHIAYVASADTMNKFELYVVPISGGPSVTVSGAMQSLAEVSDYAFTADSTQLVYLADIAGSQTNNLYISPIDGTARLQINPVPVAGGDIQSFKLSPDGVKVVYRADQDQDQTFNLYRCNLDGTNCSGLFSGHTDYFFPNTIEAYEMSSAGPRVVYFIYESGLPQVYSVTLDGGAPVKLTSDTPDAQAFNFRVTKDGAKVVFLANHLNLSKRELFWTPIENRNIARVNNSLTQNGDVFTFKLANDSDTVVYQASQEDASIEDLFSKRMSDTLPAVRISNSPSGVGESYLISPDSTKVVYVHNSTPTQTFGGQLYVTGIAQTPSTLIGGQISPTLVMPVAIDPQSKIVMVRQRTYNFGSYVRINLDGVNEIQRLAYDSWYFISDYKFTPSGSHMLFLHGRRNEPQRAAVDLFSVTNLGESSGICTPIRTKSNSLVPICM